MKTQSKGLKVHSVQNKTIDYTTYAANESKNIECCPKCKRMALVKEKGDYIYYQHILVKAYANEGIFLKSFATDECKILN